MNLKELNLEEWDGTFQVIYQNENKKILLLNFSKIRGFVLEGRSNLVCVNPVDEIIWFAEIPSVGEVGLAVFHSFKYEYGVLIGWYGGSTYIRLNARDGKIITEDFVK